MEILGYLAIPAVMIICYAIAEFYKVFVVEEKYIYIPVVVILCGIVVTVFGYVFLIDFTVANNIIEAIAIGIVSGLGSTGVHQLIKQLRE